MKVKRVFELLWRLLVLPLFVVCGPVVGLLFALVCWYEGVRITWKMRDGSYVWEDDDTGEAK